MSSEILKDLDLSLNQSTLSAEKICEMRRTGIIRNGSPYWWETDYKPDPREYIYFDEFIKRLTLVPETKNTYIYTREQVPMTTLNLDIENTTYPFMVTVRPYHPNSVNLVEYDGMERGIEYGSMPFVQKDGNINNVLLEDHFVPHIHGLFAGVKKTHLFWYPIINVDFIDKIYRALLYKKLGFIKPWINDVGIIYRGYMSRYVEKTYDRAHNELTKKGLIAGRKRPILPDFNYEWVSTKEFINQSENENLMLHYPLRLSDIEETIPLVIATRTHQKSKIIKPTVLGVAAGMRDDLHRNDGFWRIKNGRFAETITQTISEDLGIKIDTVCFNPYGKTQYQRV
ncbi:MAG: hypothetical protein PHX34_01230 [Candidatus Shapirobacteria bacterium]|nr:hypothetical protein [Candidatus Shapirobacteria bacterium]